MIHRILLLCLTLTFVFANTVNAQDIARVKQLTLQAETQVANSQWDDAIATLNTIRGIMGSLEGKPKELYNQAQEGKKREEAALLERENRELFDKLIREGDDLYDLGYYQKALDKYLEAKKLFETGQLISKIEKVSKLVSEDLAEYYDQKGQDFESQGEISLALDYYKAAQEAKYSEPRQKKINKLKENVAKYKMYVENGNQAYLNTEYRKALGLFLKASTVYNTAETRTMVPQSMFMTQIHIFDSVLAKNNIDQASHVFDTLEFLGTKYESLFRDPEDMKCFLYAASEFLGNAKIENYIKELKKDSEVKSFEIVLVGLDSVGGYSKYGSYCTEFSKDVIWKKFRSNSALAQSSAGEIDLDDFLWNYYVKSFFGKNKRELSQGHMESLMYVIKTASLMTLYQESCDKFKLYYGEITDESSPGMYEIEVIKSGIVNYQWDSTVYVFNIGVNQLIEKGLYDSARIQLNKVFGYVKLYEGDTSVSSLSHNYGHMLYDKFPRYDYVTYLFMHPSFKETYALHVKLNRLVRNQQSRWKFNLSVPFALGNVSIQDRSIYNYYYTTSQAPYGFSESGYSERNVKYNGPTRCFQSRISYSSIRGSRSKGLKIQWQADVLYLLGKDGAPNWKSYSPQTVGSVVPVYGQIQSAQDISGKVNGYQLFLTGINPAVRVYKWVNLVLGLDYINLNYNSNFSVPKKESPTNFNLKQTKPVLGFSLDFPALYKQKWGAHFEYMNYSTLFNSSTNLISELPAEDQRSGGLLTLNPMAFQLKTGIQGDFSDWSLKLDYQVFRSHVNYANISPQLPMFRFNGISWNLLSVSLIKSL